MGIQFQPASGGPQPPSGGPSTTSQIPLYGVPDPYQNHPMQPTLDDPGLLFNSHIDVNNNGAAFEPTMIQTMSNLQPLSAWVGTLPPLEQQ